VNSQCSFAVGRITRHAAKSGESATNVAVPRSGSSAASAPPRTPGAAAGVPAPAASGPHGNGVVPAGAAGSFVTPRAGPATGGGVSGVFQGMSGLTIAVLAGFAVAVAVIGLLQVWYITDEGGEFSNVGIGLWAVIAGGAVAAVCSYMEANGKTFGGRA